MEAVIVTPTVPKTTKTCFITIHAPPLHIPISALSPKTVAVRTAAAHVYSLGITVVVLIVFQNEKGNARGGAQARKGLMTGCFEDAKSFGFEEPYFFYFAFPN
eukprot:6061171-Ditylum_brightwellii.AAC.1